MDSSARVLQLGEVVRFGSGKAIKPGAEGRYQVYGSNGIIGGCDEFRYENGVIIGRVGAYCGSVAYCSEKFWASDNTLVVFPASERFDTKFLFYLLTDAKLSRYAGGAAQPLVTQTVPETGRSDGARASRATPHRGHPVGLRRPDREQSAPHPDSGNDGPCPLPRVVRRVPVPRPRECFPHVASPPSVVFPRGLGGQAPVAECVRHQSACRWCFAQR